MTSITNVQSLDTLSVSGPAKSPYGAPVPSIPSVNQTQDSVSVSPAALLQVFETGQIAVNEQTGTITGDQAQQLYSQLSAIETQAQSDKIADGGTISHSDIKNLAQMASQLNQQIQGDGGTTVSSSGQSLSLADARQVFQSGRVELQEQSGALSGAQASALMTEIDAVGGQNQTMQQPGGSPLSTSDAQTLNQEQSTTSQQIYTTAHPSAPMVTSTTMSLDAVSVLP